MLFEVLGYCDNFELTAFDEVNNLLTLGRIVYVSLDALEGIEYRCASLINVTVALGDVIDALVAESAVLAEEICIHAEIAGRIVCHNAEGGNVTGDSASALDERPFTHLGVFVNDYA